MNIALGKHLVLAATAVGALWLGATPTLGTSDPDKKNEQAQPKPEEFPEWMIRVHDILMARNVASGGASPLARSKSRLGWEWLAQQHGIAAQGSLDRAGFRGPKELFDRLDRDGDGVLNAGDFDWSDEAPFVRQQAQAQALFNRLNPGGDGTIDAKEWQIAFNRMAGRKGEVTPEDIHKLLYPTSSRSMTPPTRWHRLFGFFSGELGSLNEGPKPGDVAPDFTLRTPDGKTEVTLSAYKDKKPVVLIFGNFT